MPVLTWNNQPLTITAKVDARINPTDLLEWAHEFTPSLISDPWNSIYQLAWDGVESGCTWGTQALSDGLWRFTPLSGTIDAADHRIEIRRQDTDELLATLTAIGVPVGIQIPVNASVYINLLQSNPVIATVEMTRTHYWDSSGSPPEITQAGDTLTVQYPWTPRQGVLTATAQVYDGNGFLIATSDAITLTITGAGSGGS